MYPHLEEAQKGLVGMSLMSESHWKGSISKRSKELGAHNVVQNLTIFTPRIEIDIVECISWLNGSFLGGDDRGFLKEGVENFLIAPTSPLTLPT